MREHANSKFPDFRLRNHLVAVDGLPVQKVHGSTFPIAVAQRLDIELAIPKTAAAYPVLAVLEGERKQTGIVLLAGKGRVRRISGRAEHGVASAHARP